MYFLDHGGSKKPHPALHLDSYGSRSPLPPLHDFFFRQDRKIGGRDGVSALASSPQQVSEAQDNVHCPGMLENYERKMLLPTENTQRSLSGGSRQLGKQEGGANFIPDIDHCQRGDLCPFRNTHAGSTTLC